ncbi:Orotate phosphoribosyltransferase [Mycovorax composti]|jgi:Predicted amidophosphoribosyltransferases|uniref:Orotate phosphoribosyltransferase n=2 Tax=Chitinophagaceae TaxID=563835 RepID=A0ABZ2EH13_9BACT
MKTLMRTIGDAVLHLIYPHICAGCGTDTLPSGSRLCIKCLHQLPVTHFEVQINNPVEKILAGRVRFERATAQFYFHKNASLQRMMHQFKYRGIKDIGHQLGTIMGHQLLHSGRFDDIDILIPMPLHESRERKRGYNQAKVLCDAIAQVLNKPVIENAVQRVVATDTQTKKDRIARWQNMSKKFSLINAAVLEGKHVLLVDDVITTGATIEACAEALYTAKGVQLSIATLCYASYI